MGQVVKIITQIFLVIHLAIIHHTLEYPGQCLTLLYGSQALVVHPHHSHLPHYNLPLDTAFPSTFPLWCIPPTDSSCTSATAVQSNVQIYTWLFRNGTSSCTLVEDVYGLVVNRLY